MGRRKATYQRFVPNPPQDHSVRGQVPHKVPTRDGKGAAGSLPWMARSAALPAGLSGGHRSSALLPEESAGRSATGNLRFGALPK